MFGGHRLDLGARQLFRGNTEIHLSPKGLDLLHMLVENRPRAVSKRELQDRLWPGTFVAEASLGSLVAELRRALGDRADTPAFVRTVHRFGYAFCGVVDGDAPSASPGSSAWIVWQGREIPMHGGENIIGRDPGVTVRLDTPSISRRHARIVVSPEGATIEDLGSKNGTFLKEERVVGRVPLADLDELRIGSVRLLLRIMSGGELTQTVER